MFEPDILLCRLCRKSSGPYLDIFNPKGTRGLIVWRVIKDLIQLDVSLNDMLPNAICEECMEKLVDFRNFKSMCINSRIEFLKASASVGLVEMESVIQPTQFPEGNTFTPPTTVDSTCTSDNQGWASWSEDPLAGEEEEEQETSEMTNVVCLSEAGCAVRRDGNGITSSVPCVPGKRLDDRGYFNSFEDMRLPYKPGEPVQMVGHATTLSSMRPLAEVDMELSTIQRVQNGEISQQSIERDCPSVSSQKEQDVSSQYLERRLDESIGVLKSCDAPNCRKVFSTYKALVVHKKTKHSDISSCGGSQVERMSAGLGRSGPTVPSGSVHNRVQEAAICIAEFPCTQPSCGMKFMNLSSLLNHQTIHSPQKDNNRPGTSVDSSGNDSEVVCLSNDSDENSRSDSSDDQYMEEIQAEGTEISTPDNDSSSCDRPEEVDTAVHMSGSSTDNHHADSSIPGEPEYLCHWTGCGKGFHSFRKLLKHRKCKHSTDKGVRAPDISPKIVPTETTKIVQTKRTKKLQTKRTKKLQTSTTMNRELKALVTEPSRTYTCKWPGCNKSFDNLSKLKTHRHKSRHLISKLERAKLKAKSDAAESDERPIVARPSGAKDNWEGNEGEVRVKIEPVDREGSEGHSSTTYGDEDEAFECEIPNCPRVFTSFKALQAHFSQKHLKQKQYAGQSSKGGRR